MKLIHKFENKTAKIGVIGMGYVGLPLMLRYSKIGYNVLGIDTDQKKVDDINLGQSYIEHISNDNIASAVSQGMKATTDVEEVSGLDALILCVPTPLNKYREPDLSYVTNTIDSILPHLKSQQIVSLESTTYPGTTEEVILPRVETSGLKVGKDIYLVYSPEREDPGNPNFSTNTIPKVVGGHTQECLKHGEALYKGAIDKIVPVSSTKVAEMTKLLENIHRAVNIGLVNELKIVADKMDIDIFEVIDAAKTKPFGFTAFYPGPGIGGHCIPIDPFYLTWKAREFGLHTRFIELSGEVNKNMPDYVLDKLVHALNQDKKAINGSRVLVLGVAYKKNVDDMRESPAIEIMSKISNLGGTVDYSDPHVPVFPKLRNYEFDLCSVSLSAKNLKKYDAVVLTTDHDQFDFDLIYEHSKKIVDSRGVYRKPSEKVIKA